MSKYAEILKNKGISDFFGIIGTLKLFNGIRYKGHFKNGNMHGKGELLYPNGDRYVGSFINDKEGQGIYYYSG
ncbi:MAG: hypothetical protein U9N85_09570 [Bacteroidota bacterium]|nr:hypothetical protein [Bacteroidota bacterium]